MFQFEYSVNQLCCNKMDQDSLCAKKDGRDKALT